MKLNLNLGIREICPVRVRELKNSALCLSYDKRGIHILVDLYKEDFKAVILNGDHAFHSFNIQAIADWKGLAITDFELEVDVTSAIDCEFTSPPLGALSLTSDGVQLQVATKDFHGFTDNEPLKLGWTGPEIGPGLKASFTRWAFRIGNKDHAQYIWMEANKAED